ncbi:MAG: nucleotide-diphospho-sugar transferase [Methylotenera sp.]|nr:nucleotide-diphospho-sugar transferase [Flavobacterium sp.]
MFKTPILFLLFNRPETTQKVFSEIKKQKPQYLFLAADGPRPDNKEDIEKCQATRDIVLNGIDWDCEVKTLFRDENLGCGLAVTDAISWFFENVEQGIILEDDCLPNPSFFGFCETLLDKYKENQNVFVISGDNFQNGIKRGKASYYFSNYSHTWGWASWRRAWIHYDHNLTQLDHFKKSKKINKIDSRSAFGNYWLPKFEDAKKGDYHHIWDYQWMFAIWNNEGITVLPNVNLISNIGFGNEATHTHGDSARADISTNEIGTIIHPPLIQIHKKADKYTSDVIFKVKRNNGIYNVKLILWIVLDLIKKVKINLISLFK